MISYIWNAIIITFEQLIILLGPALLLAFIMNYFALLVRIMQQRLVKNSFLDWFCAPGIIVHELGHAFFCVVFGHRIMRMNLFRPGSHDGTLGYVEHAFDPGSLYQRVGNFFIGTGPIWFGTIIIYLNVTIYFRCFSFQRYPQYRINDKHVILLVWCCFRGT